ncbi:MAG: 2-dehydropantoate 2-reductase [Microbacteriaceae bacterium]
MRIAVIGAGAMGGTYAALLDRAGHEVEVTARGDHLAAIRADGLRLDGAWGEHVARVDAAETLSASPDLAILATKAQDAEAALGPNAEMLGRTPLVVVQNGLDGLASARRQLPESPLIGALALMACSYLSPGRVTVTAGLPTILGADPAHPDAAALSAAADALSGVMPIEVVPDFEGAQWTKLLINHVNAMPAITGWSVQQTIADPRLRRVITASMRETVRVARARGIRFGRVQGLGDAALGLVGRAPLAIGAFFPRLLAARMGSVPNPGSTLQSIRRGQLTEIESLNGAVVRVARESGLRAPVNQVLTTLVHEVEETGAFLSADEVASRVRRR